MFNIDLFRKCAYNRYLNNVVFSCNSDFSLIWLQDAGDSASIGNQSDNADSLSSTPSDNTPSASSTWTNWPNPPSTTKADTNNRPHTISSAYEKNHTRPSLNPQLFEPPPQESAEDEQGQIRHPLKKKSHSIIENSPYTRPASASINKMQPMLPPLAPKPKVKAVAPPKIPNTGIINYNVEKRIMQNTV